MRTCPWIKATAFLAQALDCSPAAPLNQQKLESITAMEVTENGVKVFRNKTEKTETIDLALLEQPQPFQRLQKLSRLRIESAGQGIRWKRILRILAALPQVEQLVIAGCEWEQETCAVKELGNLLVGAQELELENLSAESLAQLPKEMPNLTYLHVKCEIDWQLLSQIHLPKLKSLQLHCVRGLCAVSQISQAFPSLEKLTLDDVKTLDGLPLELGEMQPALSYLDVSVDELGNWTKPASGITALRIQNCSFDPSFLHNWKQLDALELKNCLLESPMPSLARCEKMKYLVVMGCLVTDFGFAKGLHDLQIFRIDGNGVEIPRSLEENQLPESLSCLAEMPNLLEFVIDEKTLPVLLERCPKQFAQYEKASPDMLRLRLQER